MSIRIVPIPRHVPRPSSRRGPLASVTGPLQRHWGLACVAVMTGVFVAVSRGPNSARAETAPEIAPPPVVETPAPAKPSALRVCGRVIAHSDLEVRSRNAGQIAKVLVQPGDVINAGDVLAELDPTDETRALKRAELALSMSQTRLAQARQNVVIGEKSLSCSRERAQASLKVADARSKRARIRAERLKQTLEMNYTSQEEYDSRETEATEAAANLDLARVQSEDLKTQELALESRRNDVCCAEAQVELDKMTLVAAQQRLNDTRILAPATGTITQCGAQPGKFVDGGSAAATLFTISDLSKLYVVIMVDENMLTSVKTGQSVALSSEAAPGIALRGAIERISPRGCRCGDKVCFEVRIEVLGNGRQNLKPEMSCCAELKL